MKYCLLLSGGYMLLMFLWLVAFVLGAGHGSNPFQFVLYVMYPARLLLGLLPDSWPLPPSGKRRHAMNQRCIKGCLAGAAMPPHSAVRLRLTVSIWISSRLCLAPGNACKPCQTTRSL